MIEFKGIYYRRGDSAPQSVLVQFDGVLLHVWHMSDPFHRLLTSDVFRFAQKMGKRTNCIKLPNGDRIESDDHEALGALRSSNSSVFIFQGKSCPYFKLIAAGSALLLLAGASLIAKHVMGI